MDSANALYNFNLTEKTAVDLFIQDSVVQFLMASRFVLISLLKLWALVVKSIGPKQVKQQWNIQTFSYYGIHFTDFDKILKMHNIINDDIR